jgi:hypothetical protein
MSKKLSEGENLRLNSLRDDLKAGLLPLLLIFSKYTAGLSAARQNYWKSPPAEPPEPNARKNSESKKDKRH